MKEREVIDNKRCGRMRREAPMRRMVGMKICMLVYWGLARFTQLYLSTVTNLNPLNLTPYHADTTQTLGKFILKEKSSLHLFPYSGSCIRGDLAIIHPFAPSLLPLPFSQPGIHSLPFHPISIYAPAHPSMQIAKKYESQRSEEIYNCHSLQIRNPK
jgi:hypothetical protein